MSEIILPRRFKGQPQYAAPLDKGHPLAKDFTVFINFATPQYNAATGKALSIATVGTGVVQRATSKGVALYTPNDAWANIAVGEDWAGPNTIIAVCRINSINNPWGGLFSKDTGSGTSTQFGVGRDGSTDSLYGSVADTTATSFGGASIPALTDFNVLAFTHSGVPSTGMSYYRNGVLVGSTTGLDAQPSGAGVLGLGRSRDALTAYDSDVDWIAFGRAKRVFSDNEIASLPTGVSLWGLQKAPPRRLWAVSAGGTAYTQSISGSLTPAGALAKRTGKALSGSSTATGALSRSIAKSFAGSITSTGNIVKQTAKAFAGSVTGSGALSTMILFTASFAGSITPSGALSKMTQKALAGASTLTGAITKLTSKGLSASITLSGALNKLTTKAFAGSITVTGALAEAYQVLKSLAGSITPAGALATAYIAFVAGVLKMLSLMGVGQ